MKITVSDGKTEAVADIPEWDDQTSEEILTSLIDSNLRVQAGVIIDRITVTTLPAAAVGDGFRFRVGERVRIVACQRLATIKNRGQDKYGIYYQITDATAGFSSARWRDNELERITPADAPEEQVAS